MNSALIITLCMAMLIACKTRSHDSQLRDDGVSATTQNTTDDLQLPDLGELVPMTVVPATYDLHHLSSGRFATWCNKDGLKNVLGATNVPQTDNRYQWNRYFFQSGQKCCEKVKAGSELLTFEVADAGLVEWGKVYEKLPEPGYTVKGSSCHVVAKPPKNIAVGATGCRVQVKIRCLHGSDSKTPESQENQDHTETQDM